MPIIKKNKQQFLTPPRLIMLSFLAMIIIGSVLLMFPFSSRERVFTPYIDCFFTATSATCVTGLIIHDTGTYWSLFGQIVILVLIQFGGIGIVTFATFLNSFIGKKMNIRSLRLASESINWDEFSDIKKLLIMTFRISTLCELIGALLLCTVFVPKYGAYGVYISVFLSISAFCNGGFDILGFEHEKFASLSYYADNPVVMITIMLLITCGGLGFLVWYDLFNYRKTKRLFLHTRLVLITTGIIIFAGSLIIFILEHDNPLTMADDSLMVKISHSIFQCVTYRTSGFNTINLANMHDSTKLFSIIIMIIGASPGSTGGGIKTTTFTVIIMTVISVIRNYPDTIILKRKVEKEVVYKSITITSLFAFALIVISCMIGLENKGYVSAVDAIFETVSAMSTAGVSVGVTAIADTTSKILLIIAMFLGRVGPATLAYSLTAGLEAHKKNEVIPEGKIIVG